MEITQQLLKACRQNNRKAQYELFVMCSPVLMGICSRYQQNDADSRSLMNEGFLKIILNLEKYPAEAPFKLWIRRIMINTIIDHFRKEKKYREQTAHAEQTELQAVGGEGNEIQDMHNAEALLQLIRQLPPVTRKVFNLFAIDGYSHFEVAQLLGISEGTSRWHVATARKTLSSLLKIEMYESVKMKKG